MLACDLTYVTNVQRKIESYLAGRLSIERAWPLRDIERRLIILSWVVAENRWLRTGIRSDPNWWKRLSSLIDRATAHWVLEMPEIARSLRASDSVPGERLSANLFRTGGCLPYSLLPDAILSQGSAAIDRAIKRGTVLALGNSARGALYPSAQFTDAGKVANGLREIRRAFSGEIVPTINFLLEGNRRFDDRSPIEILKAGSIPEVLKAAKATARLL